MIGRAELSPLMLLNGSMKLKKGVRLTNNFLHKSRSSRATCSTFPRNKYKYAFYLGGEAYVMEHLLRSWPLIVYPKEDQLEGSFETKKKYDVQAAVVVT